MGKMGPEEALDLVARKHWKHTFQIAPGIVTKGDFGFVDSRALLNDAYSLPADLSGKRALDIGTLDGVHAFELERRGAVVTALDIQDPEKTGFNLAKRIIDSKVDYVQGSVYELTRLFAEQFDVILFFGVWYHLKNPVRAFEEIAAVLKSEGILCGEGEALADYVEIQGVPQDGEVRKFAEEMGRSPLAISIYHSGAFKGDRWNWYVPNKACVQAWLETAGLEMISNRWWHSYPHQRLHVTARKNSRIQTTVDNPVW